MHSPEREEYARPLVELESILTSDKTKVIAIDGRPTAGKTTLGRFLSWRLGISLVETDSFLLSEDEQHPNHKEELLYNNDALNHVISKRINKLRQHFIIEGVFILRLLKNLQIDPDFHIRIIFENPDSNFLKKEYDSYIKAFKPLEAANLCLDLPKLE